MKPKRKEDRKLLDEFKNNPCCVCGSSPSDPAHIKTVGSGGPDESFNLISLCRICHGTQHKIGFFAMCKKHPILLNILNEKGWAFNTFGKLWNEKLKKGA